MFVRTFDKYLLKIFFLRKHKYDLYLETFGWTSRKFSIKNVKQTSRLYLVELYLKVNSKKTDRYDFIENLC